MNRRDFLKLLGIGVVAPKLVFDVGRNSGPNVPTVAEVDRLANQIDDSPARWLIEYQADYIPSTHWIKKGDVILFNNGSSIKLT